MTEKEFLAQLLEEDLTELHGVETTHGTERYMVGMRCVEEGLATHEARHGNVFVFALTEAGHKKAVDPDLPEPDEDSEYLVCGEPSPNALAHEECIPDRLRSPEDAIALRVERETTVKHIHSMLDNPHWAGPRAEWWPASAAMMTREQVEETKRAVELAETEKLREIMSWTSRMLTPTDWSIRVASNLGVIE